MFKIYDGRSDFYQWDLNRQIVLSDPTINEVHFCNKTSDCSLVVAVYEKDGLRLADVPNILLQTDWPIRVYAYCGDCYTKTSDTFKVIARTRPDDYVYTETEVKRWEDVAAKAEAALTEATSYGDAISANEERIMYLQADMEAHNSRISNNEERINETQSLVEDTSTRLKIDEKRITNIEKHINPSYFVTDGDHQYRKLIDGAVAPYAQINQIGGMTTRKPNPRNLISFPYWDDNIPKTPGETIEVDGVYVTLNADKSITFNGETSWMQFNLSGEYYSNSIGYTISFGTELPAGTTLGYETIGWVDEETGEEMWDTYTEDISSGEVTISAGTDFSYCYLNFFADTDSFVFNNLTIYPTLVEGTTALPFFDGLQDTSVSELKSEGANLIPYPFYNTTKTSYGITFTDNGDGTITLNGKNNGKANSTFDLTSMYGSKPLTLAAGTYKGSAGSVIGVFLKAYNYNTYTPDTGFVLTAPSNFKIYLSINKGYAREYNGEIVRPMLYRCIGDPEHDTLVDLPYIPYRSEPVDTFTVPFELIEFLEPYGYGRGANYKYYNYIDFERKVFVQNTYRKVFDGTEPWAAYSTYQSEIYRAGIANEELSKPTLLYKASEIAPVISNSYASISADDNYSLKRGVAINLNGGFMIYDEAYNTSDISLWKAHLAELYANGEPLTIEYALAEPIEVDISAYLSDENYIEVESCGYIVAENEGKLPAPTSISYLQQEGSELI